MEDIESAYNDSIHHRHHMESLEREATAKRKAWQDAEAKYKAGLDSAIQRTDMGRARFQRVNRLFDPHAHRSPARPIAPDPSPGWVSKIHRHGEAPREMVAEGGFEPPTKGL